MIPAIASEEKGGVEPDSGNGVYFVKMQKLKQRLKVYFGLWLKGLRLSRSTAPKDAMRRDALEGRRGSRARRN